MKEKSKRITALKLEILDLEKQIKNCPKEKPAFLKRLSMILERKNYKLKVWIESQKD